MTEIQSSFSPFQNITPNKAMNMFLLPFSFDHQKKEKLVHALQANGFDFFSLHTADLETKYYGQDYFVSHASLDQYFLPYIECILFPSSPEEEGLLRFSKKINHDITFKTKSTTVLSNILSIDVFLCPFEIGVMTIRTEMKGDNYSYDDVLEFMNHFRVLEPKLAEEHGSTITYQNQVYDKVQDYIFAHLAPFLHDFMKQETDHNKHFGSLPYFIDERMYTLSYVTINESEEINDVTLFRTGQLNSYSSDGKPFVSARNKTYIDQYNQQHVYTRWSPETYYVMTDHIFSCISRSLDKETDQILMNHLFGQHYYNLFLHFFYKIVLLKLSYEYSQLTFDKDQDRIEHLIRSITIFSGKYLFLEISSRTEGQEFSRLFKKTFHIDALYQEVKETLGTLYQNQEKIVGKRHNYLLLILTIYTVISGIYGMNLVIESWKSNINWSAIKQYSLFEYIAFIVALSGITISISLGLSALYKLIKEKFKK
ncbi:hypothetical protein FZC66_04515 [Priestia megaterium]|nr:hypothetical protein FZC66_04515 [Priestia megaterium]